MDKKVEEVMATVAIETLERLSFIFSSVAEDDSEPMSDSMAACVSFKGPFSGRLVMKMSVPVVLEMTANMLGIDEEDASTEQQCDAIKETINVICGNLLPAIGGENVIFNINAPEIMEDEDNDQNAGENRPYVTVELSVDEEPCVLYLFAEGDICF